MNHLRNLMLAACFVGPALAASAQVTFTITSFDTSLYSGNIGPTDLNDQALATVDHWYGSMPQQAYGYLWDGSTLGSVGTLGSYDNVAEGINNSTEIVGWSKLGANPQIEHAWRLPSGGSLIDLGTFSTWPSTHAYAINDAGTIVGYGFSPTASGFEGFSWSGGTFTPLAMPAGTSGLRPHHINSTGVIVGEFYDVNHRSSACRWDQGVLTDLTPTASQGWGRRINSSGDIVGDQVGASGFEAFRYHAGTTTPIGLPGATQSSAGDINDNGWIVGYSLVASNLRGFLHVNDTTYDLTNLVSSAGWVITIGGAVNNDGVIAASATFNGSARMVLLTPLSAPAGYCTSGTSSNGCVPVMSVAGTASASATSGFTIHYANAPGHRNGLIFYGISGRQSVAWGGTAGFECVDAPTQRTLAISTGGTNGACNGSLNLDWNAFMANHASALGNPRLAGTFVQAQGWLRDPPTPKTTMLTGAVEFMIAP